LKKFPVRGVRRQKEKKCRKCGEKRNRSASSRLKTHKLRYLIQGGQTGQEKRPQKKVGGQENQGGGGRPRKGSRKRRREKWNLNFGTTPQARQEGEWGFPWRRASKERATRPDRVGTDRGKVEALGRKVVAFCGGNRQIKMWC